MFTLFKPKSLLAPPARPAPFRLLPSALILILLALFLPAIPAAAIDQAMPGNVVDPHAGTDAQNSAMAFDTENLSPGVIEAFQKNIDLADFRLLALADNSGQVKIVDSWARQSLKRICNRESWEGQDPVYTALDMAFRPASWYDKNIIFVQAVPIRERLTSLAPGATVEEHEAEARRMLQTGLVSYTFLNRPEVQQLLQEISLNTLQARSVDKILLGKETFENMLAGLFIVPPPPAASANSGSAVANTVWQHPIDLDPEAFVASGGPVKLPPTVHGYSRDQVLHITLAMKQLKQGWQDGDANFANRSLASLASILPALNPAIYPSPAKRITELWYNRTFYGTIGDVFLYFIAMTLFLLVAIGVAPRVQGLAYLFFTIAVALHLASMGVRFWLAGRWPTQNEFESIMASALIGCVVGWLLETWKKNGLFGMAFSFVGFLAMTACMSSPYFGADIGGEIAKTAGILQTYWLYIHVNVVISSYALIGASFLLGLVYLLIQLWHWVNLSQEAPEVGPAFPVDPVSGQVSPLQSVQAVTADPAAEAQRLEMMRSDARRTAILSTLDQTNMVILQMAFWFLGIGIICGAIWADHSWGRPWGWDPKETFALITWIVYLIIVHIRIVAPRVKANATAWMSIAGFAIMMFNWIGVNFFLAGLHSYA